MGPNCYMWFCIQNVKGYGLLAQQWRRRPHFIWLQLHSFPKFSAQKPWFVCIANNTEPDFLLYKEETFLCTRTITIKNYCLRMGCGWILVLFFSTLSLIKCNHRSMCYWFCNCFLNGLGPKTAALVRMSFGLYIWANGWCFFLLGKPSNISVKDDLSQKAWLAMLYKVTGQRSFTSTSFAEFISDAFVVHCKEVRPKAWMLSV